MKKILYLFNQLTAQLTRLPDRQLTLVLALIVGLLSGLAAVLLKNLIHFIQWGLISWFANSTDSLLYLVYPGVGMLLSLLFVRYIVKDDIGHGVTKILYAISR